MIFFVFKHCQMCTYNVVLLEFGCGICTLKLLTVYLATIITSIYIVCLLFKCFFCVIFLSNTKEFVKIIKSYVY
jgi:hypothetical protein